MDPKFELKELAVKLRKQGSSYNEIKRLVPVSKSTLSLWLKNILLTSEHQKRLYTKQINILSRGPQSQKERRSREIEKILTEAEKDIPFPLSLDTCRLMGAALYWAEGRKGGRCEITNSDPHLILFMVIWIKTIFNIDPSNLKARLNIYSQQNEKNLKSFWSDLAKIPIENFGKSFIKPANKGYKKNNLYYGTMRIEVPRSVNLKHQIFGWIRAALKNIDTDVTLVQRRWESLTQLQRSAPINLRKRP